MTAKYRNKKIVTDDGTFDSKLEYKRWRELKLLEQGEEIFDLKRQVRYELVPAFTDAWGKKHRKIEYVADFEYEDKNTIKTVEDAKGYRTEAYKIKAKLFRYHYQTIRFIEVEE